jgi:hypothetical protein
VTPRLTSSGRPGVTASALATDGRVLLRGMFAVLHTALVDGKEISIVAQADDGRRLTIGIPVEFLENVGPADTTEPDRHGRARMSVVGRVAP